MSRAGNLPYRRINFWRLMRICSNWCHRVASKYSTAIWRLQAAARNWSLTRRWSCSNDSAVDCTSSAYHWGGQCGYLWESEVPATPASWLHLGWHRGLTWHELILKVQNYNRNQLRKAQLNIAIKLQSLRRVEMESTCSIDQGTENEVRALALGLEACVFDEGGGWKPVGVKNWHAKKIDDFV